MRDSYELEENPTEWDTLPLELRGSGAGGRLREHSGAPAAITSRRRHHLGHRSRAGVRRGLGHALVPIIVTLIGALPLGAAGYFAGLQIRKLRIWNQFWAIQVIRMIPFFLVAGVLGAITIYFQICRAIGEEGYSHREFLAAHLQRLFRGRVLPV